MGLPSYGPTMAILMNLLLMLVPIVLILLSVRALVRIATALEGLLNRFDRFLDRSEHRN